MGAKYTEAQKAATLKYIRENMGKISVLVPKDTKDHWKQIASDKGLSLSQFIIESVNKEIERGL